MAPETLETLAADLAAKGYGILTDFLSTEECLALKAEADALENLGAFRPAGVGRGSRFQLRPDVRTDLVVWLDSATLTPPQSVVWQRLDALRTLLNRRLFLGLQWFEGHLAIYGEGGHYAKHMDRFTDASARTVSFALYLNSAWQPVDGGHLRLFSREDSDQIGQEVLPQGGTLVCFLSAEISHEVLPPTRPRYSFTGWFRTDAPQ